MSFKQRKFKKRVKVENVEEDDVSDVEELSEQRTQTLVTSSSSTFSETLKTRITKVGSGIQGRSCHLCAKRKALLHDSWTGVVYHHSLYYHTTGSEIVYRSVIFQHLISHSLGCVIFLLRLSCLYLNVLCFMLLLGPILSFNDDEEDGGDFKVKKSKASRMIKKMKQAPNSMSFSVEMAEIVTSGTSTVFQPFLFLLP